MNCAICGEPAKPKDCYFEVTGWAEKRNAGGYNQIKKPEHSGRMAHKYCVNYPTSTQEAFL